ncbi:MmyB family transcriptional regulator [Streptomyces asiaticus]|uniref:MmyB family transcriptional regulator n=1 Tax=Streptomyces asiaticus TaxID=114695 RepID=UPI0037F73139
MPDGAGQAESEVFDRHWATRATAAQHTSDRKTIRHPEIGDILLDCDVLIVPGADLRMVTYTAGTGTSDAGKLDLLRVTGPGRASGSGRGQLTSDRTGRGDQVLQ